MLFDSILSTFFHCKYAAFTIVSYFIVQVQVYSAKLTCILKVLEFVNKKDDRVKSFVSFFYLERSRFQLNIVFTKKGNQRIFRKRFMSALVCVDCRRYTFVKFRKHEVLYKTINNVTQKYLLDVGLTFRRKVMCTCCTLVIVSYTNIVTILTQLSKVVCHVYKNISSAFIVSF